MQPNVDSVAQDHEDLVCAVWDGSAVIGKVGPVHFVSLNTETDFPGAEEAKTGAGGVRQG